MMNVDVEQTEPVIASPSAPLRWVMRALALAAFGVSLFLLIQTSKGGAIPGCGTDSVFDCESVLASKWSKWFDMPVSGLAMGLYVVMLVALAFVGSAASVAAKATAWRVLITGAVMAIGAAMWFVALQVLAIHAFCNWCMLAHACGFVLGVIVLMVQPRVPIAGSVFVAAIGLGVLAAGQVLQKPPATHSVTTWASPVPDTDEGAGKDREITLLGGRIRSLKTYEYPIIGSPEAEHVGIYIFDYTCPHCLEQHKNLVAARERYGDSFAIIPMVMPLDGDCNPEVTETKERHENACELAKLSLALFRADRTKFEAFHEWMFEEDDMRGYDESRAKAIELVGAEKLVEAEADPWIDKEIMKHISLYNVVSRMIEHRAIPMIVVRAMIVAGQPGSPAELFEALETEQAGMTAPPGAPEVTLSSEPARVEPGSDDSP